MAVDFRTQLQIDLATMLNQTEFGLTVNMDGKDFACAEVVESGAPYTPGQGQDFASLNESKRTLIFLAPDLETVPTVGQQVDIDGEYWYVTKRQTPLGHVILEFGRQDS